LCDLVGFRWKKLTPRLKAEWEATVSEAYLTRLSRSRGNGANFWIVCELRYKIAMTQRRCDSPENYVGWENEKKGN
jgi:plasmid maintenance system antidote protein VapI